MKMLSEEKAKNLLDLNPAQLRQYTNQLGQKVTILEHPTLGDDCSLLALIDGFMAITGFYDVDDFDAGGTDKLVTEYMPVLVNGKIDCAYRLIPYSKL